MATILPFQLTFDKDIPEDFGNFEYRQERLRLLEIDEMIVKSHYSALVLLAKYLEAEYAVAQSRMHWLRRLLMLSMLEVFTHS